MRWRTHIISTQTVVKQRHLTGFMYIELKKKKKKREQQGKREQYCLELLMFHRRAIIYTYINVSASTWRKWLKYSQKSTANTVRNLTTRN